MVAAASTTITVMRLIGGGDDLDSQERTASRPASSMVAIRLRREAKQESWQKVALPNSSSIGHCGSSSTDAAAVVAMAVPAVKARAGFRPHTIQMPAMTARRAVRLKLQGGRIADGVVAVVLGFPSTLILTVKRPHILPGSPLCGTLSGEEKKRLYFAHKPG